MESIRGFFFVAHLEKNAGELSFFSSLWMVVKQTIVCTDDDISTRGLPKPCSTVGKSLGPKKTCLDGTRWAPDPVISGVISPINGLING